MAETRNVGRSDRRRRRRLDALRPRGDIARLIERERLGAIELVDDAIRTSRHLAMMGLRSRHPGESIERLRRRLCGLVLGEELAARVYGPLEPGE